jgi:drug/metabolite transporter (DMT)-like permease
MSSVILGLVAALSWGIYDFLARFPSRAVGSIPSVLAVTFFGLVLLSVWVLVGSDGISIVRPKLWLIAVAGIFFALATVALFAAYALGPLTIVAPIIGSYPALAMILALAQGARPSALQWLAVAGVMLGVLICARGGKRYEGPGEFTKDEIRKAIGFAALAGTGFAISITAAQAAVPVFGDVETVWLARIFGLLTIGLIYLWRTPGAPLPLRWLPLLALMGALDVVALAALTVAGNLASPEFTTVVSSAFGVVTVILARMFLKEPIAPLQFGGMVLIFGGVAALAAI